MITNIINNILINNIINSTKAHITIRIAIIRIIPTRIPLPHRDHRPLIVVLLQMNNALNAPADAKRPLEHQSIVHLTASNLVAAIIEELIVQFQLRLEMIPR